MHSGIVSGYDRAVQKKKNEVIPAGNGAEALRLSRLHAEEAAQWLPEARRAWFSAGRPRLARPYHVVTAWLIAAPEVRIARKEWQISDYKRIARLPRHMGERLDKLCASFAQVRWVANGVNHVAELERRYNALVALLEHGDPQGRSPGVAFRAVMHALPKMGRGVGVASARKRAREERAKSGRLA